MTAADVGVTTFSTPTDLEIVSARAFDAPIGLVFDAFTSAEHLPHWMLGPEGWTMPVCELDLRSGGEWRFVWRKDDGTEMEMRGTYREVEAPTRVVSTESWGEDWPETVNTLRFSEQDGRTIVTQTMVYPSTEARDAALQTGMKDGADVSFERLDAYLRAIA